MCSFDYFKIINDKNFIVVVYCGQKIGWLVFLIGDYVGIIFYIDYIIEERGFLINFNVILYGKCNCKVFNQKVNIIYVFCIMVMMEFKYIEKQRNVIMEIQNRQINEVEISNLLNLVILLI